MREDLQVCSNQSLSLLFSVKESLHNNEKFFSILFIFLHTKKKKEKKSIKKKKQ